MPVKKVSGNKTDRYINLILEIASSQNWQISEGRLKELLGNPSRSQFYNYVKDLTTDYADRPAVLFRYQDGEEFYYRLHDRTWENFLIAQDEAQFMLECHKKLGYLIESGLKNIDILDTDSNRKSISRKFLYLSAVQGNLFNDSTQDITHTIIKSLLGEKKLNLIYNSAIEIVTPLTLCQYRDDLYLLAFTKQITKAPPRAFKISRIAAAGLTDESFSYPGLSEWNPNELYKNASGLILGEQKTTDIRVYGYARRIFKEKKFFSATPIDSLEIQNRELNNEFDTYRLTYTSINEFLGQLFVYADEIEIIDNEEIKQAFINKAKEALKLNSDQSIAPSSIQAKKAA